MNPDEQRLRDALRGAPPAPQAPGLGDRLAELAQQRRGTRHTALAAGAGVLCIFVAAGVLAFGPDDEAGVSADGPTDNATETSVQPATPETLDCSRPSEVPVVGAPVVPNGAVAVRLCGGQVDNGGFDLVWPADTLHEQYADQVVARLNRLEPYRQPDVCSTPGGASFDLALLYGDGSRVWVHGDTAGSCENVAVQGGDVWAGAPGVLDSTLATIREQRADRAPAGAVEAPECPTIWNDVAYTAGATEVVPKDPASITACRYFLIHPDPNTITQSWDGVLKEQASVDDAAAIVRLVSEGSRSDPCGGVAYDLDRTQEVLLVRDSRGDVQVVSTTPCWPNDLTGARRYPSEALAHATAHLLD